MTIIINKTKTVSADINGINNISFDYLGEKVYSVEKIQKLIGVFISQTVVGENQLVSWKEVSWVAEKLEGTDIALYIKIATTESGLDNAEWNGPYYDSPTDLSDLKGKYLQFIIVLSNDGTGRRINYEHIEVASTPVLSSISLSYLSADTAIKFYTKAFDLGFVPKHVLLTYNNKITDDAIVRFAISGFDSIDSNDYQYIDPNKIEELSGLSTLSTKIKVLMEMIGDSSIPITIQEFALMFSGEDQLRLNKISSSSSNSSSSSIDSSSSSSSSVDSSSSSSIDSSSSSSSSSIDSSSSSSEQYSLSSSSSSSSSSS